MPELLRRNFLFFSSGAALGNLLVPGVAAAEEAGDAPAVDWSASGPYRLG